MHLNNTNIYTNGRSQKEKKKGTILIVLCQISDIVICEPPRIWVCKIGERSGERSSWIVQPRVSPLPEHVIFRSQPFKELTQGKAKTATSFLRK